MNNDAFLMAFLHYARVLRVKHLLRIDMFSRLKTIWDFSVNDRLIYDIYIYYISKRSYGL